MRRECITHRNTFSSAIAPKRLVEKVASKAQSRTYTYGGRPFGVGVLVIFHDQDGPHLYELNPAGECLEYEVSSENRLSLSFCVFLNVSFLLIFLGLFHRCQSSVCQNLL